MNWELHKPEPWMADALCAQVDGDVWFPAVGGSAKEAKAICKQCPVLEQCLAFAVEHHEMGIWGGTSEKQRQALRREAA